MCDSPLERGRGVFVAWLTHPCHHTIQRTPSQEGNFEGLKIICYKLKHIIVNS
jgi:hypothetical protein